MFFMCLQYKSFENCGKRTDFSRVSDRCMCRNECESCRLKKNHTDLMSQCAPGCMKKNLLDLLKSSIPDISTRKLLRNCVYLHTYNSIYMYLIKMRLRISQFLKIDDHFYPLLHYLVFSRVYFFDPKCCVYPSEKSVCNAWIKNGYETANICVF